MAQKRAGQVKVEPVKQVTIIPKTFAEFWTKFKENYSKSPTFHSKDGQIFYKDAYKMKCEELRPIAKDLWEMFKDERALALKRQQAEMTAK